MVDLSGISNHPGKTGIGEVIATFWAINDPHRLQGLIRCDNFYEKNIHQPNYFGISFDKKVIMLT